MDPALQEILLSEKTNEEIEAIIRLKDSAVSPDNVRIVTRFGDIATCRLPQNQIKSVWADESVASLKAARNFGIEPEPEMIADDNSAESLYYERVPQTTVAGKDVVVGIIDWGFDFTHPNFINDFENTRFLAIWDQSARTNRNISRYGYGTVHTQHHINEALKSNTPFKTLGYHPAKGNPSGKGSHGTHVLDIAVGNGTYGQKGVAPEADIIAVHLSSGNVEGLASLGDSVRILEAIDFIAEIAGDRPLVINMSVGKHGGSHSGKSLVEQGMDAFLKEKAGRAIVQSTGNYYLSDTHTSGRISPGGSKMFTWQVHSADKTPNELEVWYSGMDTFDIVLSHFDTGLSFTAGLNEKSDIIYNNELVGRLYHRAKEPNTLDNHIDIFLYPNAPSGDWEITLKGSDVVDGKYHAWIERDATCMGCQSKFDKMDADHHYTTGTICNGLYTIAVGAINPYSLDAIEFAAFSSSGPTTDFRQKPNLVAPGLHIEAARSASGSEYSSNGGLTVKSGTSMAAPHVTGAIALLFEAAGKLLPIEETRNYLLSSAGSVEDAEENRIGNGILNIKKMLSTITQKKLHMKETNSFNASGERIELPMHKKNSEHPDNKYVSMPPDIDDSLSYEDAFADINTNNFPGYKDTYPTTESMTDILTIPKTHHMTTFEIYDFFKPGNYIGFENHGYKIVALPGEKIKTPLKAGDIMLRAAFGEGMAFQSSLVSSELMPRAGLYAQNITLEKNKKGHYAEIIETMGNNQRRWLARRITDEYGYLPKNQMVIRPKETLNTAQSFPVQDYGHPGEDLQAMETSDQAIKNANLLKRDAGSNQISIIHNRIARQTGLSHPGLPNNPLIGVSSDMIRSAYNAHYAHAAVKPSSVLLAIWVKEGGAQLHRQMQDIGNNGVTATSASKARSIFRSRLYFNEMGIDRFIAYRSQAGEDNIPSPFNDANAENHERVFSTEITRLHRNGYLSRDISSSINNALTVTRMSTNRYRVVPNNHFYIYSLLLVDALFRMFEAAAQRIMNLNSPPDVRLTYMCWNMGEGTFRQFIASAERHRQEQEYLVNGQTPSIIQWAFEHPPKANEWRTARLNAVKLGYFEEVYNLFLNTNTQENNELYDRKLIQNTYFDDHKITLNHNCGCNKSLEEESVWLRQIALRQHRFKNTIEEMATMYNSETLSGIMDSSEVLPPSRPCCILAPNINPFGTNNNLVDPANLGDHGTLSGSNAEKRGLIYCGRAGFVDLGHLRETCDLTKHIYDAIVSANGSPVSTINTIHGNAVFHASINRNLWLPLAMNIAYTDALGYEIMTYTSFSPGGHNSSFSPEDLCSNYIGVELARRAILAGGSFNVAVTSELQSLLSSLNPQSVSNTAAAFNLINHRWVDFSGVPSLMSNSYLKRRNFTRTPWKTGHSSDAPTPSWVTAPLVNGTPYYTYTHTMQRSIPETTFPSETTKIRNMARNTYGANYDKP